jgi:hypothetical protein
MITAVSSAKCSIGLLNNFRSNVVNVRYVDVVVNVEETVLNSAVSEFEAYLV